VNGFIAHLYTPLGTTFYRSLTHRLLFSVYYSLHHPFPGNGFCRGRFFSFRRSDPLVTAARREFLSTENSTNCIPGWRPFHTNLLVFSWQTDFQLNSLTHQPASSRHFTRLNCRHSNSWTKSESEIRCDWRFTANQFDMVSRPLRFTVIDFFDWTLAVIDFHKRFWFPTFRVLFYKSFVWWFFLPN
jgi:hypothetical protein